MPQLVTKNALIALFRGSGFKTPGREKGVIQKKS
jgi:hypothetical protein